MGLGFKDPATKAKALAALRARNAANKAKYGFARDHMRAVWVRVGDHFERREVVDRARPKRPYRVRKARTV